MTIIHIITFLVSIIYCVLYNVETMKIHIISNNPSGLNSGFGVVAKNLGIGLSNLGHEVSFTGLQTSYVKQTFKGMPIYPGNYFSQGFEILQQIIESVQYALMEVKPDAVICIFQGDDGRLNALTKLHSNTFWYCTVEGTDPPAQMIHDLSDESVHPVAMTHQAALELIKCGVTPVAMIYHGYDPDIFSKNTDPICKWSTDFYQFQQDPKFLCSHECIGCPGTIDPGTIITCPEEELERITILTEKGEFDLDYIDLMNVKEVYGVKKVFLFVGQNYGVRKRIERLIEAFSIFAENKDDVMLHMHTAPIAPVGLDLIKEVQTHHLIDKVMFSYGPLRSSGWSDQAMNVLYNSADFFVSMSSAEGFGLPHLESMAVGLPQIAPDFSVFPEFIGDKSRGLLCDGMIQSIISGQKRILADVTHMAECMEFLYNNPAVCDQMGKNAMEWAQQYTWDKICNQWDKLLTK